MAGEQHRAGLGNSTEQGIYGGRDSKQMHAEQSGQSNHPDSTQHSRLLRVVCRKSQVLLKVFLYSMKDSCKMPNYLT